MCSLAILLAWIHLYAFCMGPFCSVWCMALHIWFFIRHFLLELHLYVIEYNHQELPDKQFNILHAFVILTTACKNTVCCIFQGQFRVYEKPQNHAIILFYFFMFLFYLFFTFNPLYLVHNITKCNTWYALSSCKLTIQIIKYYYYSISQK